LKGNDIFKLFAAPIDSSEDEGDSNDGKNNNNNNNNNNREDNTNDHKDSFEKRSQRAQQIEDSKEEIIDVHEDSDSDEDDKGIETPTKNDDSSTSGNNETISNQLHDSGVSGSDYNNEEDDNQDAGQEDATVRKSDNDQQHTETDLPIEPSQSTGESSFEPPIYDGRAGLRDEKKGPVCTDEESADVGLANTDDEDAESMSKPDPPQPVPDEIPQTMSNTSLHALLQQNDWEALTKYLDQLKEEDPSFVCRQLTAVEPSRLATPLHVSLQIAPRKISAQIIKLIPPEYTNEILMAMDTAFNTPIHIACTNVDIDPNDLKSFSSIIRLLTLACGEAYTVQNQNKETPLYLLLSSRAMRRRDPTGFDADEEKMNSRIETIAGQMVETIIEQNPNLIREQTDTGATILHAAASNAVHDSVWRALLASNGNTSASIADYHGMLPLHCLASCISGEIPSAQTTKRLVDAYPLGLTETSNTGDTPLHLFVSNISNRVEDEKSIKSDNTSEVVKLLIGNRDRCPLMMTNGAKVSFQIPYIVVFLCSTPVI
jgi:hypothetical protein